MVHFEHICFSRRLVFSGSAIFILFAALCPESFANVPPTSASDASIEFSSYRFLTQRETWVALAVLSYGLLIAGICMRLLSNNGINPSTVIRLAALLMILPGILFLVAAGYNAQEIAPAIGLLGTVAGYVLGRGDSKNSDGSGE